MNFYENEVNGEYFVISGRKGNRSLNKNKYSDDAEMLKQAYLSGEDVDLLPRYAFYCAQSYRDAGLIDEAIEWYKERAILENKGWKDEVSEFFKVVVTISRIKRLVIFAVVALLQDLALLALQARSSSPPEFPSVSGFHL